MTGIAILFLGGAKRVSLAERFIREGERRDTTVRIISYELTKEVPIASCAEVIAGKRWTDPAVLAHITEIAKSRNVMSILPFVDPATVIAAQLKGLIPGCTVPVSDTETCKIFLNKRSADAWFEREGFPVPRFEDAFPAIAKPVAGSASKGIQVLRTRSEHDAFFESQARQGFLLQKYVRGQEFTVDCYVAMNGDIISVIPRLRLDVAGGEVMSSRTVDDAEIIALGREIITRGKLRGPINIQFIREAATNKLFVMEVNPRFGGGALLSIEAGANMPLFVLNECAGIANMPVTTWDKDLFMTRAHREFFS